MYDLIYGKSVIQKLKESWFWKIINSVPNLPKKLFFGVPFSYRNCIINKIYISYNIKFMFLKIQENIILILPICWKHLISATHGTEWINLYMCNHWMVLYMVTVQDTRYFIFQIRAPGGHDTTFIISTYTINKVKYNNVCHRLEQREVIQARYML